MSDRLLSSNGIPLPDNDRYVGPLSDTSLGELETGAARERLERDGYVLLRGILPREHVLDIREEYLELFPAELVQDGDFRTGNYSGHLPDGLPKHGVAGHPAHEFVRSETFRRFADQPILRELSEDLLGGPVERIRRTPLRHFLKDQQIASRAHFDGTYIAGGPNDILTLWVPVGDCPIEVGGLVYLEDSHHGVSPQALSRSEAPTDRPDDRRPITHDLKWMSDVTKKRWLVTNYQAGDVIAHTPQIVHASLDPKSDLMRISTDIRFIKAGSPTDPRWKQYWSSDDGY